MVYRLVLVWCFSFCIWGSFLDLGKVCGVGVGGLSVYKGQKSFPPAAQIIELMSVVFDF